MLNQSYLRVFSRYDVPEPAHVTYRGESMPISFRCILTLLLFVEAAAVRAQANDDWANHGARCDVIPNIRFYPSLRSWRLVESSTFDGNDVGDTGGAIQSQNNLRVSNSAFSGNHVAQAGGGIRIVGGLFTMSSSTVAFNHAGNPGNDSGGGLFLASSYDYVLFDNIIAGN